ncbi:UNVERIFIED_CONTAM: hypothetical protein FKN15_047527 [Acipenser sinensis]
MKKFTGKKQSDKFTKKRKPQQEQDEEGSAAKKPKWDEFKKNKKELKQNRQQNERKNSYYIINRSKQVWEAVRSNKQQVSEVMNSFKGQVRKMLRHAEACTVVEYAYNDKAILEQRLMLTEELYGNTFQLCKSAICPTLDKVLESNPEKQASIMDEMKQILTSMAHKN